MCIACDIAESEHSFSLAECPAYLRAEMEYEYEESCIQTQDDMEARGHAKPCFHIYIVDGKEIVSTNDEIPF